MNRVKLEKPTNNNLPKETIAAINRLSIECEIDHEVAGAIICGAVSTAGNVLLFLTNDKPSQAQREASTFAEIFARLAGPLGIELSKMERVIELATVISARLFIDQIEADRAKRKGN